MKLGPVLKESRINLDESKVSHCAESDVCNLTHGFSFVSKRNYPFIFDTC